MNFSLVISHITYSLPFAALCSFSYLYKYLFLFCYLTFALLVMCYLPQLPVSFCAIMPNQRYLDVIITINGFQHGEEEFVLKAMAIVSCFHHTQWTLTYDTNYLLKRPRTHLVTYHKQSAHHGHPLLKSGIAQFSALKHFLSALHHSTPLVGRKTDASASPTSLDKSRPELSFPESMVASDHPDSQLGRH